MKHVFFFLLSLIFLSSCVKQEPIPQSALTGIWKLNGYQSTNYQVEMTKDGYLYWWNYDDIFNNVQEFELEYDINANRVRLYRSNGTYWVWQFTIYQQRNGRLYFSIQVSGSDVNGNAISRTDTYYKMS